MFEEFLSKLVWRETLFFINPTYPTSHHLVGTKADSSSSKLIAMVQH